MQAQPTTPPAQIAHVGPQAQPLPKPMASLAKQLSLKEKIMLYKAYTPGAIVYVDDEAPEYISKVKTSSIKANMNLQINFFSLRSFSSYKISANGPLYVNPNGLPVPQGGFCIRSFPLGFDF